MFDDPNVSLPLLTSSDPGYSREGGLDPLGLYAVADSLAIRLVPGVRERMRDPRYLTAIAVGHVVCDGFEPDALAADGKSEPWQVYEWYVVEGLVRYHKDHEAVRGLPGVAKARDALAKGVSLSFSTYLKTAYVFGFHGIYRGLGQSLKLFDDSGLLESGWELVDAWETDQGLNGFHSSQGDAASRRKSLHGAVQDGLTNARTSRKPGWSGWDFIGKHLAPHRIAEHELAVLQQALSGDEDGSRRQVWRFLLSVEGQSAWHASDESERRFHEALQLRASPEVCRLLDAIFAYERFARLAQDAFNDCLHALTSYRKRCGPEELARTNGVFKAAKEIREAYQHAAETLEPVGEHNRFVDSFRALADATDARDWIQALLEHHIRTQQRKPPNGKNPWFDTFDDGSIAIRAGYMRDQGARGDDQYVHAYRTQPLLSFASNLGLLSS